MKIFLLLIWILYSYLLSSGTIKGSTVFTFYCIYTALIIFLIGTLIFKQYEKDTNSTSN